MGSVKHDQNNPSWWTTQHTSAWDRVKDAFARDWEQTKADFSKHAGAELDQNAKDTVKQAAGKEPIPPAGVPNAKDADDFQHAEPALRYGYGASSHFSDHKSWDPALEGKLRADWERTHTDEKFDAVKDRVRKAWERARNP